MMNARTGLAERVSFQIGSALALPFPNDSFDALIMQHVAMNIADRAALYAGIHTVLRNGGQFLTYDIIEQTGAPSYPVPWSPEPRTSFLLTETATREALEHAGFTVETWQLRGSEAAAAFKLPPGVQAPPIAAILGRPSFAQAGASGAGAMQQVSECTRVVRTRE